MKFSEAEKNYGVAKATVEAAYAAFKSAQAIYLKGGSVADYVEAREAHKVADAAFDVAYHDMENAEADPVAAAPDPQMELL